MTITADAGLISRPVTTTVKVLFLAGGWERHLVRLRQVQPQPPSEMRTFEVWPLISLWLVSLLLRPLRLLWKKPTLCGRSRETRLVMSRSFFGRRLINDSRLVTHVRRVDSKFARVSPTLNTPPQDASKGLIICCGGDPSVSAEMCLRTLAPDLSACRPPKG